MASARVTSTPSRASRVVAAASTAGVASDSAQGQVTTSTASTAANARDGSTRHQASRGDRRPARRIDRDEPRRRAIRGARDARARGLGAFEQLHHRGQRRVSTVASVPQRQRRAEVDAAAANALARAARARPRIRR